MIILESNKKWKLVRWRQLILVKRKRNGFRSLLTMIHTMGILLAVIVYPFWAKWYYSEPLNADLVKVVLFILLPLLTLAVWYDWGSCKDVDLWISRKKKAAFVSIFFSCSQEGFNLEIIRKNDLATLIFTDLRHVQKYLIWESTDLDEVERVRSVIIESLQGSD